MSEAMETKIKRGKRMKKSALEMTEIVKKEIIFYLLGFCLTRLVPLRVKILLNDTYPRKYVNYRQTNTKEDAVRRVEVK